MGSSLMGRVNVGAKYMSEFNTGSDLDVEKLQPSMFAGCVVTVPAITPFIAAARAKGCGTMTGAHMFGRVRDLMVEFLLGK